MREGESEREEKRGEREKEGLTYREKFLGSDPIQRRDKSPTVGGREDGHRHRWRLPVFGIRTILVYVSHFL